MEGKSLNSEDTYRELAKEFDIEADSFIKKWNSDECKYETQQQFHWVRAANISGFPCTILQRGEQYYLIASGYRTYNDLDQSFLAAQQAAEAK